MKSVKLVFFFAFSLLSMSAYSLTPFSCTLKGQGIPANTLTGKLYTNVYNCQNNFPLPIKPLDVIHIITKQGSSKNTYWGGACANGNIPSGGSCDLDLNFITMNTGISSFDLRIEMPGYNPPAFSQISTETKTPIPVITWSGRNSGSAVVGSNGNGSGQFVADASDSSGQTVYYSFALSGSGKVIPDPDDKNQFELVGAKDQNETVIITAKANDASDVAGNPIKITQSGVPAKTIKIYNNSNEPIYPVLSASITLEDKYLQAEFQTKDPEKDKFAHTKSYRVYIDADNGIPAGQSVTVTAPFYSKLVENPTSAPDQYVDWWNGVRIYIYDQKPQITGTLVTLKSAGPSYTAGTDADTEVKVYSYPDEPLPNEPSQLAEYTFANIATNVIPYLIFYDHVDYDISYVDDAYLPMAIEPFKNKAIGYIGTTQSVSDFHTHVNQFLLDFPNWPHYNMGNVINKKLPSGYKAFTDQSLLIPNPDKAVDDMKALWTSCTSKNSSFAQFSVCENIQAVKQFFDENYNKYTTLCSTHGAKPLDTDLMIRHVYGWVPFNACADDTFIVNPLYETRTGSAYTEIQNKYIALQYSSLEQANKAEVFNPYAAFIHGGDYLKMHAAYAFSIDDAVGNMNEDGEGIIVAVGGDHGLINKTEYNPKTTIEIGLGQPAANDPVWTKYGICTPEADQYLSSGSTLIKVGGQAQFPCKITLEDSNNSVYQFTIKHGVPLSGSNSDNVDCSASNNKTWCEGVNVDAVTKRNIGTPPPTKFNPNEMINIYLGMLESNPWTKYGICSEEADEFFSEGQNLLQISGKNRNYPCAITLQDRNNKLYQFEIKSNAPLTTACIPGKQNVWCENVQSSGRNINTQPPNPEGGI